MTKNELRIKAEASLLQQLYRNYLTTKFDVTKKLEIGSGPRLDLSDLIKDVGLTYDDFHIGSDLIDILADMQSESLIEDMSSAPAPLVCFGIYLNGKNEQVRNLQPNTIEATGLISKLRPMLGLD